MTDLNPVAAHHLPFFITPPGETDVLFVTMAVVLIGAVLAIGVFFFWLHSLPERMVHNKIQFDIVAVLALLSLFTHQHAFWVAALLIALIDFPSFSLPEFLRFAGAYSKFTRGYSGKPRRSCSSKPFAEKESADHHIKIPGPQRRQRTIEALPNNAQTDQLESASANGRPRKQGR